MIGLISKTLITARQLFHPPVANSPPEQNTTAQNTQKTKHAMKDMRLLTQRLCGRLLRRDVEWQSVTDEERTLSSVYGRSIAVTVLSKKNAIDRFHLTPFFVFVRWYP